MNTSNYFSLSRKGTDCPYKPITCSEGFCRDCQIFQDYQGHQRTMGRTASLQPEWLREYEREQMSLVQLLKIQVTQKRDEAFAQAGYGSRDKRMQFKAQVDAYDIVLRLIDKILGGKND